MQGPSARSEDFSRGWRLNKYSLVAQLYFFFNQVFLPKGLLYTHLLSPWWFYKLWKRGEKTWIVPFGSVLLAYSVIHFALGADLTSLLISTAVFVLTYFTVISLYSFACSYPAMGKLFRDVLLVNSVLVLVAVAFVFMPRPQQEIFWYFNRFTKGFADIPRLSMFTYEASYYSLLMVPVFYYYLLKLLSGKVQHSRGTTAAMVTVPVLLSLSFGVIGATIIAAIFIAVTHRRLLLRKRAAAIISWLLLACIVVAVALWLANPENPLFVRLTNIFSGDDTSARGRTTESFGIAWRIASMRSVWFGVGLGQVKHVMAEVVLKYYNYWGNLPRYDIPNAMAETLAIFGITGVIIRLALEWWLFFRTKVRENYYRLALFVFIFIYQFTGSYITNVAEYAVWLLAFSNVFPVFNKISADTHAAVSARSE